MNIPRPKLRYTDCERVKGLTPPTMTLGGNGPVINGCLWCHAWARANYMDPSTTDLEMEFIYRDFFFHFIRYHPKMCYYFMLNQNVHPNSFKGFDAVNI